MADTDESYEIYIASEEADEFRRVINEEFGPAVELSWRDSTDEDDECYEIYIDSDRSDEFAELVRARFGDVSELNWLDTIEH